MLITSTAIAVRLLGTNIDVDQTGFSCQDHAARRAVRLHT